MLSKIFSKDLVFHRTIWLGWGAVAGAVAIYAGNFVVSRYAIKESIGIMDMVALRFAVAGIVMAPLFWRDGIRSLATVGVRRGFILTALAGPPFALLMIGGLSLAPVAHGAPITGAMIPVSSAIGMRLITGRKIPLLRILLFILIFAGLAMVSGFSPSASTKTLLGDFLFILCGSMWGAYAVMLRQWQLDSMPVTIVISLLSLLFLPVYFILFTPDFSAVSWQMIGFLSIYQGVLASIVSLLLFSFAVKAIGPQRATLGNATVPIFATLLAVPALGELPTPFQWLGIVIVVSSVIFAAQMQDTPVTEK